MKIDLHIHTLPNLTINEPDFDFQSEALIKFVQTNNLDCIAITNHNFFNYENFKLITEKINNCLILPGIEISLENGHILLIGNNDENTFNVLNYITNYINDLNDNKNPSFSLTLDEFLKIKNLQNFIIIPHYLKDPNISTNIIEKIQNIITAYEVSSQAKFFKIIKTEKEKTPVLFSDFRAKKYEDDYQYRGKYTYLKCDNIQFKEIKNSLLSNKNVSLNTDYEYDIFDIYSDKVKAFNGINVLLGKRSSGKTWLLNSINEQFQNSATISNNQVLYIKQFEITEKDNFEEKINNEARKDFKNFLIKLIEIFNYIQKNVNNDSDSNLNKYLKSLKSYAEYFKQDIFSKSHLFNYDKTPENDTTEIIKIIKSISNLQETNSTYKNIIKKYISFDNLDTLIKELRQEHKKIFFKNFVISYTNEILKNISLGLESKSSTSSINECDFRQIFKELYIKIKFNNLIKNFKEKKIKKEIVFDKFKKTTILYKENNKRNKKINLGISAKSNCDDILNGNPFDILLSSFNNEFTKDKQRDDLIYLFFNFHTKITDMYDCDLSGGQKSEYTLLQKLKNYNFYDVILIDEIENSFDNPFIDQQINTFIREISKNSIVFISTHNNNIGINLKPDFYIYCETLLKNDNRCFNKYYGKVTDVFLKDANNNKKSLKEILMTTMEASEEAYEQRRIKYNIKN